MITVEYPELATDDSKQKYFAHFNADKEHVDAARADIACNMRLVADKPSIVYGPHSLVALGYVVDSSGVEKLALFVEYMAIKCVSNGDIGESYHIRSITALRHDVAELIFAMSGTLYKAEQGYFG